MTDRPHYTVKDHNDRPLAFDLVGVKRGLKPQRLGEQPAPIQQRGMSDSVIELQKRYKETNEPEVQQASRDDPPKFYSESLPMQGHVGRGLLYWSNAAKKWSIKIDGVTSGDIEIYPDTRPEATELAELFIVLSAKQGSRLLPDHFISRISSKVILGFQAGSRAVPKPKSTRDPSRARIRRVCRTRGHSCERSRFYGKRGWNNDQGRRQSSLPPHRCVAIPQS